MPQREHGLANARRRHECTDCAHPYRRAVERLADIRGCATAGTRVCAHARARKDTLLLHAMACAGEVNSISMPSPSGTWTWDCTANCTALPFCAINAFNKGLTGAVPASIGQLSCRKNVTAVYALATGGCVSTIAQAGGAISSAAAAGSCLGITSPDCRKS